MYHIHLDSTPINTFPTLRALAHFCDGTPDLRRYLFLRDTPAGGLRMVSWRTIEIEIGKIRKLRGYDAR